jgi:hypothetical protein
MKKYKCPDCGKEFSEGSTMPVECPICGCPFEKFEMIEIIEETSIAAPVGKVDTNTSEKVYYADSRVKITNKIWSFRGDDAINSNLSGVIYIPFSSISCISVRRYRDWWIYLLLGIISLIGSIILFDEFADSVELIIPSLLSIVTLILFIIAYKRYHLRELTIKPHNPTANYSLKVRSMEEANKYLTPMLLCLKENS